MTEQQQKLLQEAKDAVAKEYGLEFKPFLKKCIDDDYEDSLYRYSEELCDKVCLKHNELCEAKHTECLTELRNTYLYGIDDNGDVKASMSEIITLWDKVNELLPQPPK